MRRHAPLVIGLVAVLLAAAWTHAPTEVAQKKDPTYREVLKLYAGQVCGFSSSEGRYYLHFPEVKSMNWQSTKLVEVGQDYVKIRWDDQERYVPIGNVELLVGKR